MEFQIARDDRSILRSGCYEQPLSLAIISLEGWPSIAEYPLKALIKRD